MRRVTTSAVNKLAATYFDSGKFDQEKDSWFGWTGDTWERRGKADAPRVTHVHFTGTGTRRVQANGRRAIEDLFTRSFGAAS